MGWPQPTPWEVKDNRAEQQRGAQAVFHIERTVFDEGDPAYRGNERAATCWDYGLACVIEAALNLRDGTVR